MCIYIYIYICTHLSFVLIAFAVCTFPRVHPISGATHIKEHGMPWPQAPEFVRPSYLREARSLDIQTAKNRCCFQIFGPKVRLNFGTWIPRGCLTSTGFTMGPCHVVFHHGTIADLQGFRTRYLGDLPEPPFVVTLGVSYHKSNQSP